MKRFHVHLHVEDIAQSVGFYSKLFAAAPTRLEADYAKWMLEDPRVNFAISTRGHKPGIDHLGFQSDDAAGLAELKQRAAAADSAELLDEGATSCCYAQSEKHWVTDPQGIAWEHFHTLADIPVFSETARTEPGSSACCAPVDNAVKTQTGVLAAAPQPQATATTAASACCSPAPRGKPVGIAIKASSTSSSCC